MRKEEEKEEEYNPLDDIADRLNFCRLDFYKLYEKERKAASVRLRHNLEFIIQTAKQLRKDALKKRKEIELKNAPDDDSEIWD